MQWFLPGLDAAPNVHPVLVHFPIALWLTALLFWLLATARRRDDLWNAGRWLLYIGTVGGLMSVASGFWATEQMGHDSPGHGLVHVHRNFMVAATTLAVLVAAAAYASRRSKSTRVRAALTAALVLTAGVMTVGADRGAELVFRYGIGTAGEQPDDDGHDHEHGAHDHDGSEAAGPIVPPPGPVGDVDLERSRADEAEVEQASPAPPAPAPAKGHDGHDYHDHEH